ncbi:adenylate/guanylate cyclase domain-containing protein [Alkalinema sp. FACHB-956]|uniref:adenylate/guanylate cyclase domain-containing protein n=1 Tax=Alkalinema sp. FACHB-956 TaxID=2692768 RepID=UPI0016869136|nr:adenylate/guanylate cyclase domain-containing protein [Alkalinema sp. FACHB-956]MBD2326900.1 GAF domain-containing protein [Alkalinema sp. FACHB-956]
MLPLNLKRLLSKKDTIALIHQMVAIVPTPIAICDAAGNVLVGEGSAASGQNYPVTVEGTEIGCVKGHPQAQAIANLLNYLASKELEKRTLAQETLDRYKEITLLYDLSDKISANLDLPKVAELVLHEAQRLIPGSSGAVILIHPESQQVETIAAFGSLHFAMQPYQGILGKVLHTRNGEIINDVAQDDRADGGETSFSSLIVAPLNRQDQAIGLLCLGSETPITYTAADLKLVNALASQAAAAIENALLQENKVQEARIKSNLERYVPTQLVQAILDSQGEISLAPVRKNISILFSDIRNFTSQCEELPPETIVNHLNEYFTHMVDVIFHHQGTVNKFVGDMIVALFGAPSFPENSEVRAIEAAIAMQRRIQTHPVTWIREHFHTGIGISSGSVIVGNIGSPQHMDYTAIGDQVNTASRLQSLAKGGQILVSRSIYEATRDRFEFKEMGQLTVKGKRNAVDVMEVIYDI